MTMTCPSVIRRSIWLDVGSMRRAGAPNTFGRGGRTEPRPLPSPAVTRLLRSEWLLARRLPGRMRDPRRIAAILLLALTAGLVLAFLWARGELAGSDALAYWTGVQRWLAGSDYYVVVPGNYIPPAVGGAALCLFPVDAVPLPALGAAALEHRLGRLALCACGALHVVRRVGVRPAAAGHGADRGAPRAVVGSQPRHGQHQHTSSRSRRSWPGR